MENMPSLKMYLSTNLVLFLENSLAKNELSSFICFDFQSPFGWIE